MLGIAAAVVIWLSLTIDYAEIDAAEQGPKAVAELLPAANTKDAKEPAATAEKDDSKKHPAENKLASGALTPPPNAASAEAPSRSDAHPPVADPAKPPAAATTQPAPSPEQPRIVVAPIQNITKEIVPGQLQLPVLRARQPLASAPDPGLIQNSGLGPLPMISTDGRQPWITYRRPFDKSNKMPRIALVITGLGLSSAATNIAIQSLPGPITLAFAPYADRLDEWIRLARAAGHEVLLNVPMEPINYPEYDPGPQALLTSLSPQENVERLLWTLSRATGYVGVVDFMGSRFTTSRKHLRPILKMLKKRGLMFLDSKSASRSLAPVLAGDIGIPFAESTRFIDERASRFAIDKQLQILEAVAKKQKTAIGIGSPYPVTLERILNWLQGLKERGIVLAPVSAMVK